MHDQYAKVNDFFVQLTAILETFGRSLHEEAELQILKKNLSYLNQLNEKWGLYKKVTYTMIKMKFEFKGCQVVLVKAAETVFNASLL